MTTPRPDGPPPRFPGLDAVRALGASAVVATHCGFWTGRSVRGPLATVIARMDVGVALFFVLSGFLLFRPFAAAHVNGTRWPSTPLYLVRRALRILPAYWVVVTAALLLLDGNARFNGPVYWLRDLTLTQIYGLGWGSAQALTQTWSLATEVAFYLLLPALAALVLRRARRPVVALFAVMVLSPAWYLLTPQLGWPDARIAAQWLPGYLDWFGAGMLLALLEVQLRARTLAERWRPLLAVAASPGTCWAAAGAALLLASTRLAGPQDLTTLTAGEDVVKNLLYLAVGALLMLPLTLGGALAGPSRRAADLLDGRVFRWLGEISYGIFLWHLLLLQGITNLLDQRLFTGSWLKTFALTWCASVVVASASYVLLERPALRLKDRLRRTGRSADQTAASPATQSA